MSDKPMDPAELARQLGRLLKSYLKTTPSAHEALPILAAFEDGLAEPAQNAVTIHLPLRPRIENESSFWDGYVPNHSLSAKDMLLVTVGADFLDCAIEQRGASHRNTSRPSATVSINHSDEGVVLVKQKADAKPHRLVITRDF